LGEREVLVVSQFTLYGDARKGNRPSYVAAARPELAEPLYERFADRLGAARGVFGAMMEVELVNDGPVTLLVALSEPSAPDAPRSSRRPPFRRRAAAGPPALRPLGADPDPGVPGRLPGHRQRGREPRRARRGDLVPGPHVARAHLRARDGPDRERLRALRLRQVRAGRRRRGAERLPLDRRLHGRDRRGQPRLAD